MYASHYLRVPWFPTGVPVPFTLWPVLVIDTAIKTGASLRKAARRATGLTEPGTAAILLAAFTEPPRVRFWYEEWPRAEAAS